jgi:putative transposase
VENTTRSHGAAHREVTSSVEHRPHKGLNNRTGNSHRPARQRERATRALRSVCGTQWFLAASGGISPTSGPAAT